MSLLMTFVYGLFAGGVVLFAPAVVPKGTISAIESERVDGEQLADGISDVYVGMAMSILGRAVMIVRSNGGQVLKRSSYDGKHGGEKARLGGTTKKWRNPSNLMHSLKGYPFGIVHEDRDVIFDIRTAYAAEYYHELKERGRWLIEDRSGEDVDTFRKAFANVAEGPTLVNIRAVTHAIQSSAEPELAERIDEYVEKMESMFNSSNVFEYLPWVIAAGAGLGLMWLAAKLADTTGGTGVAI